MFSFVGYIVDVDEPELRLVGIRKGEDTRFTISLDGAVGIDLAERPERVTVELPSKVRVSFALWKSPAVA